MNITIERIMPCLADPEKIRFVAKIDEDISEYLPYLNAIIPKAIYNHTGKSLTITMGERIITIYPNKISAGKINDEKDANEIIKWIKEKIDYCKENKEKIKPDYKRKDKLEVLHVYKLLPQKNCKKCGENSCLAFSIKLINEEKNIIDCKEIFLPEYDEKRKLLFDMLKASGYNVPSFY
ncbi:MAG: Fe-S cluster protein [Candidatus Omnitrophica bacterium]|nr:Fe-S cluster protein [Candidatus Omnitrophota bacterium]MCM8806359.1 Fe-S cluster protein [Candidatus Omnitrophota bacterium]